MHRRRLLATVALGTVGAVAAGGMVNASTQPAAPTVLGLADADTTVEPAFGAGLFDVDPDQGNLSQDANVVVTGDVAVLPEDKEF